MTLLAKSFDRRLDPDGMTLAGHSLRVARAARSLVDHLEPRLRQMFALGPDEVPELGKWVVIAALLHDIGKCSDSFQATVRAKTDAPGQRHPFLHEFLSTVLAVGETELGAALGEALSEAGRALVAAAIAGHHLRAQPGFERPRSPRGECLAISSRDLEPVWQELSRLAGCNVRHTADLTWTAGEIERRLLLSYTIAGEEVLGAAPSVRRALGVAKALVIAADIVGSAIPEHDTRVEDWVAQQCGARLSPDDLDCIAAARLNGAPPRQFQQSVAASRESVTLVTAGCGNGKTLAAYLWARHHSAERALVFCYPTTGTASSGFEDYLLEQTDIERALLHTRAAVDIERMQRSPEDDDLELWAPDVLDRWGKKIVACTVDTALGCFANVRSGLATLPLFARAAFVFDEVHSYDRRLFGALLTFLERVRAPTLLMTASLGEARHRALEKAVGASLRPIHGDPAIEGAPRYRLANVATDAALAEAQRTITNGGGVLWVCNTVSRAQAVFDDAVRVLASTRPMLYHSRFRYEDRVGRQNEVVSAFRRKPPAGQLVVATQVCEMSLDISADLLVTEWAPLPALVQRLGRLNRRDAIPASPKACLLIDTKCSRPYSDGDLTASRDILTPQLGRSLSQADLAQLLAQLEEPQYEPIRLPFFDDVTQTNMTPLRDGTSSLTVIRDEDVRTIPNPRRADVVRLAIPMLMPKHLAWEVWPRLPGAVRAPAGTIDYSLERGASWAF